LLSIKANQVTGTMTAAVMDVIRMKTAIPRRKVVLIEGMVNTF
jgi:hypothetical protein